MPENSSSIDLPGRWFLRSGIQGPDGGVARYYRVDLGRNAPVSTEITGYAIGALVYLHQTTGAAEFLGAAQRAADFLTSSAWDSLERIFPFECSANGEQVPAFAYFFDSGIILRGLLALWRITRSAALLEAAGECGNSMARDFREGSCFHPILTLPGKRPLPHGDRWSRRPGCYQLKSALGLLELGRITGNQSLLSEFETLLAFSIHTHGAFLPGSKDEHEVMDRLHAYCYLLEALLAVTAHPECRQAIREGVPRVSRYLREIGGSFARSDVYAQLLRVRLWASAAGVLELNTAEAEEEAGALPYFQYQAPDPRLEGGFAFGRKAGELLPYANPVSTAFSMQALEMWRRHLAGEKLPPVDSLI